MAKDSLISKTLATAFIILTLSAIGGIITMIILYEEEISTQNPTPRPTIGTTTTGPPPVMRLPKTLIPHSYKVFLQPHLYTRIIEVENVTSPNQTMSFSGNSTVYFDCVESTQTIYLHSLDLTLTGEAAVRNTLTDDRINVLKVIHQKDQSNFLEIQLEKALEAGETHSLFLAFTGQIYMVDALYASTYQEGDRASEGDTNTLRYLAATNMEPTHARKLFPCFDEPEMKAVFNVTIIHRRNTVALGNEKMLVTNIIDDEWQYTTFNPTPKMSTYLFAFTVSEFTTSASSPHERVEIKTYARPEAMEAGHADFAASITGKILTFLEDYLGSDYQLRSLDQIALPDLPPAAMENWGMVTYQERALLYEEGVSSPLQKRMIATIIAHELSHQWFGNLVTMKWWNQIWLNEGFATYMSYITVDHVAPSLQVTVLGLVNELHRAFEEDSLVSSHPLSVPEEEIQTYDDIIQLFDDITYLKGALVVRMLHDFVGDRIFRNGIKTYLSDFKYKNVEQNDLWKSIQKAVDEDAGHIDVAKVMSTWTEQTGFPIITINTTNGEICQKQFLFNDSVESSNWWYVPIRVMSNISEPSIILLTSKDPVKKNELISKKGEWILANVNCTGYFKVNYNLENWERLLTQMETDLNRIPLFNRGQLIDDAFNLARAKSVDVTLALNSTRFLRSETEYLPWESAMKNLKYFVQMFDRTEVYGPMQAYLRQQVTVLYNSLRNYTDKSEIPEDHALQSLQVLAVEVACRAGLPECIEMASKWFSIWMNNGTNFIHPNLRYSVYCHAVAAGGRVEWEFMWNKFLNSSNFSEKHQLLYGLSCTNKIWLLNRYLEYTLDPEKIRPLETDTTINYIAKNVAGQALAWNFLRAHWDYFRHFGGPSMIQGVTGRFSKQFELEELERFASDYGLGGSASAVTRAIEQTKVNIEWVNEYKDTILEWFERETSS
ncbi:alanyl (membrane) aminopeptidase-like b [Antennarius striatus]|uniref:alanyl (membrane) aminopeptidase-like b n=1 Tax=Antennarius striatus TaxID=241820 RepID=UPI0035B00FBC